MAGKSVSWRDYVDTRFHAIEVATNSARETMEKRLEGMNEFRSQLKDQASMFVTRTELDRLNEDVRVLREKNASLEGKASQGSVLIAYALSGIAAVVGILNIIFRAQ